MATPSQRKWNHRTNWFHRLAGTDQKDEYTRAKMPEDVAEMSRELRVPVRQDHDAYGAVVRRRERSGKLNRFV